MKEFLYYTFGCILGSILGNFLFEKIMIHIIF